MTEKMFITDNESCSIHLYCSDYSKDSGSSVPGTQRDTKCTFLIMLHEYIVIMSLEEGTLSICALAKQVPRQCGNEASYPTRLFHSVYTAPMRPVLFRGNDNSEGSPCFGNTEISKTSFVLLSLLVYTHIKLSNERNINEKWSLTKITDTHIFNLCF